MRTFFIVLRCAETPDYTTKQMKCAGHINDAVAVLTDGNGVGHDRASISIMGPCQSSPYG